MNAVVTEGETNMEHVTAPVTFGVAAVILAIVGVVMAIRIAAARKDKAERKKEREELLKPGRIAAAEARRNRRR